MALSLIYWLFEFNHTWLDSVRLLIFRGIMVLGFRIIELRRHAWLNHQFKLCFCVVFAAHLVRAILIKVIDQIMGILVAEPQYLGIVGLIAPGIFWQAPALAICIFMEEIGLWFLTYHQEIVLKFHLVLGMLFFEQHVPRESLWKVVFFAEALGR